MGFSRLRESNEVADLLGVNVVELQRLYVLIEVQGKSVGKLLIEASVHYAKGEEIRLVMAWSLGT